MKTKEAHRIVPAATVATVLVVILALFEALLIGGVLELKASTVARIAPWAYEPFLKLVGEHPESKVRMELDKSFTDSSPAVSAMSMVSNFNAETLLGDTNDVENVAEPEPVPEPEEPPEEESPKDVVPVG